MEFIATIEIDRKTYRFKVKQIKLNGQVEQYRLFGKHHNITLQSNRPLLFSKGLKHRKPNWKVVEGNVLNMHALQKTIEALEAFILTQYRS